MLRLFLPAQCLHCGVHTEAAGSDLSNYLCPVCERIFGLLEPPTVAELNERAHTFSDLHSPIVLAGAYRFQEGEGLVQTLIHYAKYAQMMRLARTLGARSAERIFSVEPHIDHIIPIPLHPTRLYQRGFNQAEEIAAGLGRKETVRPKFLRRIRQTQTQTRLTPSEREENVRGVFQLHNGAREALRDKSVMLIDDVMTTGATLASAAKAVDEAQPKYIVIAAVAVVSTQDLEL